MFLQPVQDSKKDFGGSQGVAAGAVAIEDGN